MSEPTRRISFFILLLLLYAYPIHFWPEFHAANESIRLYFVQALVDHGTASIDPVLERYEMNNADRATYRGRSYLDKAPGLSLAVAPVYWLLTRMGMSSEFADLRLLYHLLLIFGVALPAVAGVYWTYRIVLDWTHANECAARSAALVLAIATPYAVYSTLFMGHAPAAALAIGSFHFLRRGLPAVAGALAGAMVLIDTPTAILAAILAIHAGARARRSGDLLRFSLAALPFVAAQLAYNWLIFDHPLLFAYAFKASPTMAKIHSTGVYGFTLPTPESAWGLLVGAKRGLFYHAPILLLAPAACFSKPASLEERRDRRALFAILAVYFLWIASFGDWVAGAGYGPRHLLPLVPFAAVAVGLAVASPRGLHVSRWLLPPLLLASAFAAWVPVATFPYALERFDAPLVDLALPLLATTHLGPNLGRELGLPAGWSLVPIAAALVGLIALLGPTRSQLLSAPASILLVAAAVWAQPAANPGSLSGRCFAECVLEHPKTARALCTQAGGTWRRSDCDCRLGASAPTSKHPPLDEAKPQEVPESPTALQRADSG